MLAHCRFVRMCHVCTHACGWKNASLGQGPCSAAPLHFSNPRLLPPASPRDTIILSWYTLLPLVVAQQRLAVYYTLISDESILLVLV
jgi:hypothetical protein